MTRLTYPCPPAVRPRGAWPEASASAGLAVGKPRVRGLCHVVCPGGRAGLGDLVPEPDVGSGEQVEVGWVGGLEGREAGGLPFGLGWGVAAGGHEAKIQQAGSVQAAP